MRRASSRGTSPPKGKPSWLTFFGPKRPTLPPVEELHDLTPDLAIKVIQVGDLGLIEGRWPILDDSPHWQRERRPIPIFVRTDDPGRVAWRVEYDANNPNRVISERRIPYDTAGHERNALCGAEAAEIVVSRSLA